MSDKMDSMSTGGSADERDNEEPLPTHRRPGPTVVRFPTEPRFWKTAWDNPREPMLVGLAVVAALLFGSHAVTSGGSVLFRVLGMVTAAAGLLLLASYILRFHQAVLDDDRWLGSRTRRVARAMLKYCYYAFEAIALLALLAWFLTWLAGRF